MRTDGRGPFMHSGASAPRLAAWTLVAMAPALAMAAWRAGAGALATIAACAASAWIVDALLKRRLALHVATLVTGCALALTLPQGAPWWIGALGGLVAVAIAKHAFGGRRRNPLNPAAFARATLMLVLPAHFLAPEWSLDGVSGATALAKEAASNPWQPLDLLLGEGGSTLAQAAPWTVVLGGLFLLALRVSDWRTPLTYLGAVALAAMLLPAGARQQGHAPWLAGDALTHLLAGGTIFTAFFLLTDPVTSPATRAGRTAAAALAGAVTVLIRFYTPYPDGAIFAVLAANLATPALDRLVQRRTAARLRAGIS
jgi:electron transport complex protein RnfD